MVMVFFLRSKYTTTIQKFSTIKNVILKKGEQLKDDVNSLVFEYTNHLNEFPFPLLYKIWKKKLLNLNLL